MEFVDYSRQAAFDEKFIANIKPTDHHAIIGCGGVGFWLGIILAMQGYSNFYLVDGQKLDLSNLNRIPVNPDWAGINKTVALRKIIKTVRPLAIVNTINQHVNEDDLEILERFVSASPSSNRWHIWDCTDDARIQRKVFKWSRDWNYVNYRKIGYEGFSVGTYTNYDVWTTEDYRPGYRTSNACAASSALAAVIGFMAHGLKLSKDINLNIKDVLEGINKGNRVVRVAPPLPAEVA